jgi:hypothetical protein
MRTVWWLVGANPDCSPWIDVEVRTTKKPEHGTVEIVVSDEKITNFGKESEIAHCIPNTVDGVDERFRVCL